MSRESDSSSSGPQGRGNAVYPSGTPPYGTPRGEGEAATGAAAQPEEQKTETTLTTRIKINIPGSRPIPPVVVRKPVGEESGMSAANGATGANGTSGEGAAPGPDAAADPAGTAPRLPRRAPAAQRPGGATARPGAPTGSGETTSSWFAPRKGQSASSTTGSHRAPGASSTTGSHPVPGAPDAGGAAPSRPDMPYFSDAPAGGAEPSGGDPLGLSPFDGGGRPARETSPFDAPAPGAASPFDAPAGDLSPFDTPAAAAPSGPTTGPARGRSAVTLPPGFSDPGARGDAAAPVAGSGGGAPSGITGGLTAGPAGGPAGGPKSPSPKGPKGPGPRSGARDRVSGDTLVGGIPRVPAPDGPSGASGKDGAAAAPASLPKIPEPINPTKKKGRNKLVLVGAGVVVLAAVAYGAGLLLDHADVPNNTSALGVDIGGQAKDEAVKKLEAALKDRTDQPLKLTVDGAEQSLDPVKAGLGIDVQATVRNASGRDYNPVSVIGSLFGVARTAQPAMTTDDEKLEIALRQVAGGSGGAEPGEGGITFAGGRAVPHYGKPHKAVDVAASKTKVADAYRERVTTGTQPTLTLAASTQRPRVSKEAVDKALKQFAEPAMSGLVTVRTDAAHTVSFSPQKSIPKFLSFRPGADGSLVPYYDRAALQALYGDTFNGVLLTKGDGSKKPVTPAEVASAVQLALQGTTPADRVQTIGGDAG
ncbi:hypothetical protein [Streptomyces benahoarensis]|uniref:Peptidoglycan binding domain-containing protein n=1 Tax=Streptomyces benahoarensis TaxID=2595054 RepID=A0A553ZNK7_9ACTN|nr:hypothetical protein [Streptomyces benahoarensis]TSB25774.1 hypothetical protein FNJ62_12125 [Streptomyces benahoarensis]TSB43032.1 hypothetical protein FNZ23_06810 [Streptomyces benahoarensis]